MGPLLSILGLLFVALLTFGTAMAVTAEFSLTSLERSTVDAHVNDVGDRRARSVQRAHRSLSFQLSGTQVAITLTTLVTGYVAEPLIGDVLLPGVAALGLGPDAASAVSLVLAILLATTLSRGAVAADHVIAPLKLADSAQAALLQPGDVVDVVAADAEAEQAAVIAARARVVTVPEVPDDRAGPAPEGALVLVDVDAQTATALAQAAASATLSIIWR